MALSELTEEHGEVLRQMAEESIILHWESTASRGMALAWSLSRNACSVSDEPSPSNPQMQLALVLFLTLSITPSLVLTYLY